MSTKKPRPKLPASGGSWRREGAKLTLAEKPSVRAETATIRSTARETPTAAPQAGATSAPAKKES